MSRMKSTSAPAPGRTSARSTAGTATRPDKLLIARCLPLCFAGRTASRPLAGFGGRASSRRRESADPADRSIVTHPCQGGTGLAGLLPASSRLARSELRGAWRRAVPRIVWKGPRTGCVTPWRPDSASRRTVSKVGPFQGGAPAVRHHSREAAPDCDSDIHGATTPDAQRPPCWRRSGHCLMARRSTDEIDAQDGRRQVGAERLRAGRGSMRAKEIDGSRSQRPSRCPATLAVLELEFGLRRQERWPPPVPPPAPRTAARSPRGLGSAP